jgi:hypothetical protein
MADLLIKLFLELIEFVLGLNEAFNLLGQTAVFVVQGYQPLFDVLVWRT